jgi:GNAT superfamily N-acetyltransferase
MTLDEPTIRRITAEETQAVRRAVLRPGRPPEETIYPGDEHAETIHLGAFSGTHLTEVATLMREPCPWQGQDRDWRLRAIAVVGEERGSGVGGALLAQIISEALHAGGRVLWCHGRTRARSFYERHGFQARGEEFESPQTGPHYLFLMELGTDHAPATAG